MSLFDTIWNWCVDLLSNEIWFYLITTVVKLVLMFAVILAFVVLSVWIERRVAGWIQDRPGPNRAGIPLQLFRQFGSKEKQPLKEWLHFFGIPETCWIAKLCTWLRLDREIPTFGLMQPCLDGGKLFLKQELTPSYVRKVYFTIAPMLVLGPPMVAAAVIPFASSVSTEFGVINMVVANIGIGPLWIFAISGLSVYGLTLAGWSSNSKYPFLGGLRATAQLISYEVAMGSFHHPAAHGVQHAQHAGHRAVPGRERLDAAPPVGRGSQLAALGAHGSAGSELHHLRNLRLCRG